MADSCRSITRLKGRRRDGLNIKEIGVGLNEKGTCECGGDTFC